MTPPPEPERVFPLSTGSEERAVIRAPRVFGGVIEAPRFVMGNRSFMRTWAARRFKAAQAAARVTIN